MHDVGDNACKVSPVYQYLFFNGKIFFIELSFIKKELIINHKLNLLKILSRTTFVIYVTHFTNAK
jgi:hypothetical protein